MSKLNGHSIYEFDRFRLDRDKLMVYRDGSEVSLPPKAVETLAVLAERSGEIVSKAELIDSVWHDSVVEESNLSQYLYLLRKTLGTRPDGSPYIETLRRRGYRFTASVSSRSASSTLTSEEASFDHRPERRAVERRGNVLALVDWQENDPRTSSASELAGRIDTAPITLVRPSLLSPMLFVASLAFAAILGGGLVVYFWPNISAFVTDRESRAEISVSRLTNSSFVWGASISQDGSHFAYSELDTEGSRLFVQQTGGNARVELVYMQGWSLGGTAFSPDGSWVYFLGSPLNGGGGSLFRIPTIGGSPTKLLSGAVSTISFSPDGKEIAFTRTNAVADTSIVIADRDARTERVLVHRHGNVTIGSNPAWSPDGTKLVFSEVDRTGTPVASRLRIVDASTGVVTPLSDEAWDVVNRIEWVPDGSGIVTNATRTVDRETPAYHYNLYHVSFPEGISRRISSDGNRHDTSSLGISKDGSLVAVPSTRACQIWSMSATGDASTVEQLTRGSADGRAGLAALPDGRIAYTARTGDNLTIWISDENGLNARQVTTGFDFNEEVRADPAGRFLVFSTAQGSTHHLFRIDLDGGGLKQLTFGNTSEIDSTVSPDGKTVITDSNDPSTNPTKTVLKKLSAEGGEPNVLEIQNCENPVFSPDGSMISCVRGGTEAVIANASDGRELSSIKLPSSAVINFGLVWKPDATGLVVITREKGLNSNLTVMPLDGSKTYRLTNFTSGTIYRFAFSKDGSRLFMARGYPTQDAVLIRNALQMD